MVEGEGQVRFTFVLLFMGKDYQHLAYISFVSLDVFVKYEHASAQFCAKLGVLPFPFGKI
jgi:hypothetical protein